MGFVGQPGDVGERCVFLASDKARYLAGQTVVIEGGTRSMMDWSRPHLKPLAGRAGHAYVPGLSPDGGSADGG